MAIYVKLTNGSAVPQTWSGSNLSVPFNGAAFVTIEAFDAPAMAPADSIAAPLVDWILLNAPAGTAFNQARLNVENGGDTLDVNPLLSSNNFILDIEGTWFFRCTRTDTSESIDFVVATNNVRTNTRIPAAGETTEADQDTTNHAYPLGSPSGQGWAKDRNYALDVLDDLSTSGGVQLCYWDGIVNAAIAPWSTAPAGLKSGASFALTGATHPINHTTGERVPIVTLADGDANFEYVGLFKSDTTGSDGTVTAIPSGTPTLVWVSRSGVVEAAPNVIDTTAFSTGEILYLSKTAGILLRGNDRFLLGGPGGNMPQYEVPACLVLNSNASGMVMTLPAQYLGGIPDISKTFRFSGIGDFAGLRVGSTQSANSIDNELFGAVEMLAYNSEAGTINQGTVCILTYTTAGPDRVQAYIADSNPDATVGAGKRDGIIGIAIENVLTGEQGHFCIYGPVANTTLSPGATAAISPGAPIYVGSSRNLSQAGTGVLFEEVSGNWQGSETTPVAGQELTSSNDIIPIGQVSNVGVTVVVMVGFHQELGFLSTTYGGLQRQALPSGAMDPASPLVLEAVGNSFNKTSIQIQDGTASQSVRRATAPTDQGPVDVTTTVLKVAGSGADSPIAEIDMYECKLPGTALYQVSPAPSATDLAGEITATLTQNWPGAVLVGTGGAQNTLYGTFCYDQRLDYAGDFTGQNIPKSYDGPTRLKVYGYVAGNKVSSVTIAATLRFNVKSLTALPVTNETPDYPFWTFMLNLPRRLGISTNPASASYGKELCIDIPLYDNQTIVSVAGAASGSPPPASGTSGNKIGSTGIPNLSFLSPGPDIDSTTGTLPIQGNFENKILTVDVSLTRADGGADEFVVTQVVLESDRRIQVPQRRSYFEGCWPAYAFLTDAGSKDFRIENVGGVINPAPPASTTAPSGAVAFVPMIGTPNSAATSLNNITGFIPRDPRASNPPASGPDMDLVIYGRFSGPTNVAADTLGLQFYVKEVDSGDVLNSNISLAVPEVNAIDSIVPVLTTATGEVTNTEHTVLNAGSYVPPPQNDNVIGWWFKIERSTAGSDTDDIDGAEVFYQMSNVQLRGVENTDFRLDNNIIPEAIYEEHVLPAAMIDGNTLAFNGERYNDISGFNFGRGLLNTAYFTTSFDYRYDDKSGLIVDVLTAMNTESVAPNGDVTFQLGVNYSDCGDQFPVFDATYDLVGTVAVSNTAALAANEARFIKHTFLVPPQRLWSDKNTPADTYGAPNVSNGANKGTARWYLKRTDSGASDAICLGAVVRSDKSNKASLSIVQPANINENYLTSSLQDIGGTFVGADSPVYIPTYPRIDPYRTIELSIQRFTWQFTSPASWISSAIAAAGEAALVPAGLNGHDFTTLGNPIFGHFIPYSFAITDVYGYCVQKDSGLAAADGLIGGEAGTAQVALDFRILEVPAATGDAGLNAGKDYSQDQIVGTGHDGASGMSDVIVFPGVQGFPFTVYPNENGNIRWNATNMTFEAGDTTGIAATDPSMAIPKAMLPTSYMTMTTTGGGGSTVFLGPAGLAGRQWQLCCFARNVSAASIYPIVNISVEIALVPQHTDNREGLMGGSRSSTTKKTWL